MAEKSDLYWRVMLHKRACDRKRQPAKHAKGTKVADIIADRIIELLEQEVVPWRKPWSTEGPARNLMSKREYTGVNTVLLGSLGYDRPYYLTFNQINELGGKVRKGEKGCMIVFWKPHEYQRKRKDKGTDDETDEVETVTVPLLRYYFVWNVAQVDGIEHKLPPLEERTITPIEQAEQDLSAMPKPPTITHDGGQRAYYRPTDDTVHLPKVERFDDATGYYATKAHEIVHSTGHKSRLDRFDNGAALFGDCDYSYEELVAEMGSAMLCCRWGLEQQTINNSAAYIANWLTALENDKSMVIRAASAAQKAVDYILSTTESEVES